MYAPHLGKFLQTDPVGYGEGMNLYAYVGNDLLNKQDPLGLCGVEQVRVSTGRGYVGTDPI